MNELFRRLFLSKSLAVEIIVASFFVNILFLASPIFVIQILSRYIGYGFDGTLYTLTGGMLIAMVLGMGFSVVRTRMCAAVSVESDFNLHNAVLDSLAQIKASALERIPQAKVQEVLTSPQIVQGRLRSVTHCLGAGHALFYPFPSGNIRTESRVGHNHAFGRCCLRDRWSDEYE